MKNNFRQTALFAESSCMKANRTVVKRIAKLGLLLMMGMSMNADAGLFGSGGTSWKEEVLLHDGQKIMVERTQLLEGRHEIGQGPPIKEHSITFTPPGANKAITWKDEFSADIGHANFTLLALHILNGVPYIVTTPDLCLAYNKWGRPNPPYVFFKYDGRAWQRIQLPEFPATFKNINLIINTYREGEIKEHEHKTRSGFVSAQDVKEINSSLTQPEYKSILREPIKQGTDGSSVNCMEEVRTRDGWLSLDWFSDQPSYESCLKFCERKGVSPQNCPCKTLFKGAK